MITGKHFLSTVRNVIINLWKMILWKMIFRPSGLILRFTLLFTNTPHKKDHVIIIPSDCDSVCVKIYKRFYYFEYPKRFYMQFLKEYLNRHCFIFYSCSNAVITLSRHAIYDICSQILCFDLLQIKWDYK